MVIRNWFQHGNLTVFFACCAMSVVAAMRHPIVVVRPMDACAPGERAYAEALSKHVVRWLGEGGVAANLADDRSLEQVLSGRKLAYLVMCQKPHAYQLGAIKRFLARGGRILQQQRRLEDRYAKCNDERFQLGKFRQELRRTI